MVIAHHLILTGYGHWLSNDPRGSMSMRTYCPELAEFAKNHFGRRKVRPSRQELRAFYREAQKRLSYPVLWWDGTERRALVEALGNAVRKENLTCYACAVLRNHAHLLIRKHRLKGEQMLGPLKEAGREALCARSMAPADHPVFSADRCCIFKSTPEAVRACVEYIERNCVKHNLTPASCDFVTEYDNFPFHKQGSRGARGV